MFDQSILGKSNKSHKSHHSVQKSPHGDSHVSEEKPSSHHEAREDELPEEEVAPFMPDYEPSPDRISSSLSYRA